MTKNIAIQSTQLEPGLSNETLEPKLSGNRWSERDVGCIAAPPIPAHRKAVYDYYKLTFDKAGCPMKQTDSGMVFHPILPPYLVCDLILEFEKNGDGALLQHAEAVLQHALDRADTVGNALVFTYRPESGLSQHPYQFYSALTQTWYIKAICELSRHVGTKYNNYLAQVFCSLQVPIEQGGVLVKKEYGWILEEYPTTPPLYTLNGWLTVLRMIIACAKTLDRFSIDYKTLLDKNLDAVEHLLPLYDAEFCLNSRYQLTGFTRLRLVLNKPADPHVSEFGIYIPKQGRVEGSLEKRTKYRWENYVERSEDRLLQFNIVLSLISHPEPNIFSCNVTVDRDCQAKVLIADGDYRPDMSAMPTERWKQISTVNLSAGANNQLHIDIDFDKRNIFAYPTNFKKKIGNIFFNAYHFVHIVDLAEMYAFSKRELFKEFVIKWLAYHERWAAYEILANRGLSMVPYKYGNTFRSFIEAKLLLKSCRTDIHLTGGVDDANPHT